VALPCCGRVQRRAELSARRTALYWPPRVCAKLKFGRAGALSRELAAHAAVVVGIDVSARAVETYNRRVADQGIDTEEMRAVAGELSGSVDKLGGIRFDVIVVCASASARQRAPVD
jgi:hypothetical protein